MYAVVDFTDYRKEQCFKVVMSTSDVEYAKKVAFQIAKKELGKEKDTENSFYKITTKFQCEYLHPVNKIIICYKIIKLVKHKKGFKIESYNPRVYAVIELNKTDMTESVDEIEQSFICDNYYSYDDDEEDDDVIYDVNDDSY